LIIFHSPFSGSSFVTPNDRVEWRAVSLRVQIRTRG
jgi:hypothetical protein